MNPKRKGSKFEREVCRALSNWLTAGKRQDVFWRSAMSGGRATIAGESVRQCGDICAVAEEGYHFADAWFVECKHIRSLAFDSFMVKRTGPVTKFWRKLLRDARKFDRDPMLICRQNGWPVLVLTQPSHLRHWVQPIIEVREVCDVTRFDDLIRSEYERAPRPRLRRSPPK